MSTVRPGVSCESLTSRDQGANNRAEWRPCSASCCDRHNMQVDLFAPAMLLVLFVVVVDAAVVVVIVVVVVVLVVVVSLS